MARTGKVSHAKRNPRCNKISDKKSKIYNKSNSLLIKQSGINNISRITLREVAKAVAGGEPDEGHDYGLVTRQAANH